MLLSGETPLTSVRFLFRSLRSVRKVQKPDVNCAFGKLKCVDFGDDDTLLIGAARRQKFLAPGYTSHAPLNCL